jgi:hypothetical protein
VPTRQYASFGFWSRRMPASEMAARLGLEPDEISVRGADLVDPPVPSSHEWKVTCRDPEISVDEQVNRLMARLTPFASEISQLAEDLERNDCGGARLRIVRHAKRNDDEPDTGWRLDRDVVRFLQLTRADVTVDEP